VKLIEIDELLKRVVVKEGSDLHLRVPSPPVIRVDGELKIQEDLPPLSAKEAEAVLEKITNPEQKNMFLHDMELDSPMAYLEWRVSASVLCASAVL
jgi:twitching motility protein PilT